MRPARFAMRSMRSCLDIVRLGNEVETGIECNPPFPFEKSSWLAEAQKRMRNESTDFMNTKFVQKMKNGEMAVNRLSSYKYCDIEGRRSSHFPLFPLLLSPITFDKQNPSTLPSPLVLPPIPTVSACQQTSSLWNPQRRLKPSRSF